MINEFIPRVMVDYCKEGKAISDFEIEEVMEGTLNSSYILLHISTENLIQALRVYHKERKIELTVLFRDIEVPIDNRGEFEHYPEGFLDTSSKWLVKLI